MSRPDPRITWATTCIFGDSIAEGAGDETGQGWADLLKADWKIPRPQHSGNPASSGYPNIYNLGIDGDRVIDVLNRFDIEAAARKARDVVVSIGANDLTWADDRPVTGLVTFTRQYDELLALATSEGRRVLCINLLRVDESGSHGVRNVEVDQFNAAIADLVRRHQVELLDIAHLLTPADFVDGIHPNHSGAQKLYQAVKAKLTQLDWGKL